MSPGVEDTEEDMGDYHGIRTAAEDSGRSGQQPGGSEGSTEYNMVVVCSKDLAVKGSCIPNRFNKFRERVRQGEARRGGEEARNLCLYRAK